MDAVWLAAVGVALVGWAVGRNQRSPARRRTVLARPASAGLPSFAPPPGIPSFVEELEDDDIDVTLVTASPFLQTADGGSGVASPQSPMVNLMYEEAAEADEVTSPDARLLISAVAQSDRGKVRQRNEDSVLAAPEFSLYAVADGMGGYEGGEVASTIAVETLRTAYETASFEGSVTSHSPLPRRGREVACAIQMANHAIMTSAARDPLLAEMGTTVVAARFSANKQRVYIGHVGDSRCYRLRGQVLRQLTRDHTLSELGMKGPSAKQLFQAVGHKAEITIDLVVDRPESEDTYLLCSDGLTKMVSDQQIRSLLVTYPDVQEAVGRLVELANQAGGKDNVTVILVKVVQLVSYRA